MQQEMKEENNVWSDPKIIEVLERGGVMVMPTDTIYGIVAKAENKNAVENVYVIRKRKPNKPCIVLIGSVDELEKFGIVLSPEQKNKLKEYWPISAIAEIGQQGNSRGVSVVLDCSRKEFEYLHRGTNTLAFRLPKIKELRNLLLQTGPLIAPSANTETFPPSDSIEDAKKYFGDSVDLYVDGGVNHNQASQLIKLNPDGSVEILRA